MLEFIIRTMIRIGGNVTPEKHEVNLPDDALHNLQSRQVLLAHRDDFPSHAPIVRVKNEDIATLQRMRISLLCSDCFLRREIDSMFFCG